MPVEPGGEPPPAHPAREHDVRGLGPAERVEVDRTVPVDEVLDAAVDEADGDVVSRHELIAAVWGEEHAYDVSNQALDALVRRLRDRLAEANDDHSFIVTVRGHGLRLDNPQG